MIDHELVAETKEQLLEMIQNYRNQYPNDGYGTTIWVPLKDGEIWKARVQRGVKILTYRAIPHPIAESWQKQLMSVRKTHKTDAERVASVIRIEAQIRSLFGVEVSREYRGER
jgi:hypothetical protein